MLFQFTHPGRGATICPQCHDQRSNVSIHAPREGCDLSFPATMFLTFLFQFTHPGRGATVHWFFSPTCAMFQFTHPGRGATILARVFNLGLLSFNSRTPGGVRLAKVRDFDARRVFQFTHPGRGATISTNIRLYDVFCFNSRTPGGVRHLQNQLISSQVQFQFTHPGRGATEEGEMNEVYIYVSIHAPREGCDSLGSAPMTSRQVVSIHAPREGCDLGNQFLSTFAGSFNSRTPGGVRLVYLLTDSFNSSVSIHAPREGCDSYLCRCKATQDGFNSRTPGGVRQCGAKLRIMGRINKRNLRLEVLL